MTGKIILLGATGYTPGAAAVRVDLRYFIPGDRCGWMSGGTRAFFTASLVKPALGPVEAFRLEQLEAGCAEAGIKCPRSLAAEGRRAA